MGIDIPFESIDSLASFLNLKLQNEEHDFLNEKMCDLDDSSDYDHFISTQNPNGSGNSVDVLIVTHEGKVIFEY